MNETIRTLMSRDGISEEEATEMFNNTLEMIESSSYSYDEVEDILACELGLEMDYIHDFI